MWVKYTTMKVLKSNYLKILLVLNMSLKCLKRHKICFQFENVESHFIILCWYLFLINIKFLSLVLHLYKYDKIW